MKKIRTTLLYAILTAMLSILMGCYKNPYEKAMTSFKPIEVLYALEAIYDINQLLDISNRCKMISNSFTHENAKKALIDPAESMTKKPQWFGLHLTAIQRVSALTTIIGISDLERNGSKLVGPTTIEENPFM